MLLIGQSQYVRDVCAPHRVNDTIKYVIKQVNAIAMAFGLFQAILTQ